MGSALSDGLLQRALGGGREAQEALRELIGSHPDPRIRMFAEFAAQQQQTTIETVAEVVAEESPDPRPAPDEAGRRKLIHRLKRMQSELRFQRAIGDSLAAALGACYLCWGGDEQCEECSGEGVAGWQVPDAELFEEYVAPALRRAEDFREASRVNGTRNPQTSPADTANERKPS